MLIILNTLNKYYFPHFTGKEAEAQSRKMTFLRPYSQLVEEQRFRSRSVGSGLESFPGVLALVSSLRIPPLDRVPVRGSELKVPLPGLYISCRNSRSGMGLELQEDCQHTPVVPGPQPPFSLSYACRTGLIFKAG